MMAISKHDTITVWLNPWLHLDPNGAPIAVVLKDVNEGGRGFIGATVSEGKASTDPITVTYKGATAQVKATGYIRDRLQRGELFVEPDVARQMGIRSTEEPVKLVAAAKARAVAQYDAQHGDGAWSSLNEPKEITTEPAKKTGKAKE